MPRICRDKEEMRKEYSIIRAFEKEIETRKQEVEAAERFIRYCKETIRNTYKLMDKYDSEPQWQSHNSSEYSWEYRYMWEQYDGIWTEEEEQEYREANTWRICSPYDCTGQWFTRYISVFRIPALNRTIVYHAQALDV